MEEIFYNQTETYRGMELISFGVDEPLSREDIIKFSDKDGDPMGYERLQEDGRLLLSFAKKESNRLSPEDFECLKAYYIRQYDTPLFVYNNVQKIKRIKVLGRIYQSRVAGQVNQAQIYAYRPDNYESDDLEGVMDTQGNEHRRAGTIEYFFLNQTEYHENGEVFPTDHCFAFVSWYKNPRLLVDNITTGTSERNRPFRREYEVKSSYSILPVHKLNTVIHMASTSSESVFIALETSRQLV